MVARGQRAVMYVPIVVSDQVVGFLCAIERRHSRRFTHADEAFATRLADEAGVAVASARVIDRLDTHNRELRLLLETGSAMASSVDLHATLVDHLRASGADAGGRLVGRLRPSRRLRRARGRRQPPGAGRAARPGLDRAALHGRLLGRGLRDDAHSPAAVPPTTTTRASPSRTSPRMAAWGEKATLSVPLVYGDEVLGVLDVAESRYPRRFTADEIRLAVAIGDQAALAIHNARLFEETARRNAELATLLGVASTLSSTVDQHGVLVGHRPAPARGPALGQRRGLRLRPAAPLDAARGLRLPCAARTPTRAGRASMS